MTTAGSIKRKIIKFISPAIIFFLSRYLRKERHYSYRGIKLLIPPGIFHPGLFFSTKLLLNHISNYNLTGKKVLELGAGSGLISIYCKKNGAIVTASDISENAVRNLEINSAGNSSPITIIRSDLFDNIPVNDFDMIIINPPYFAKDPVNESGYAWYCGKDFQYYKKLFSQLGLFSNEKSVILMILSEYCSIAEIIKIAETNNFIFRLDAEIKNWFEINYIYSIESNS